MNRRAFLISTVGALAAGAAARRPNVIVIVADDLGYADVGFQGAKDIPTPHLDRLAAAGVRFTNACVSHPFCSPTRAGLMTGRYQQRFGHENNPKYDPSDATAGLPLTETLLPQVLSAAGYATGIIGKWHLGATAPMHPLRRGFQEQFGFIGGGHDYFKANGPEEQREYFIPIERNGKPAELTEYLTDAFSREAEAFVRRHAAGPFFLYLAYNAPHAPLQVPDKYLERVRSIEDGKRKPYGAMVTAVDDGVGRVTAALQELKLENDTLVFFLGDNGGPVEMTHASNGPLRGQKGHVYEGGFRVPFVMRWTGRIAAGRTFDYPVISLDIFPTAAALAGAKLPAKPLDGVDLMPYVTGARSGAPHQRLFWRTGGGESWAVREGRYKLVRHRGGAPELYDLETDIGEAKDIAAAKPEVAARLDAARAEWDKQLMQPLFESPGPAPKKKQ